MGKGQTTTSTKLFSKSRPLFIFPVENTKKMRLHSFFFRVLWNWSNAIRTIRRCYLRCTCSYHIYDILIKTVFLFNIISAWSEGMEMVFSLNRCKVCIYKINLIFLIRKEEKSCISSVFLFCCSTQNCRREIRLEI